MHSTRILRRRAPVRAVALMLAVFMGLGFVWTPGAAAQTPNSWARVDLEFDDAPLSLVFQSLADVAGLNVLLDPSVEGKVSFTLRDVPAREAIDLVARLTGYRYHIIGNTLVVGTAERLRSEFRSLDYELFTLRHVELATASELIARLFPDVDIIPDARTNSLIVRGAREDLLGVSDFLAIYDRSQDRALEFRNAAVADVLWALAGRAGWNLVIEGEIEGSLTANLEGMDYTQALALVSDAASLNYRLGDGVLYVRQTAPPPEPEPVHRVAVMRLNHVDPMRTQEALSSMYPDMSIQVEEQSRMLVVGGEDGAVAEIEDLVRRMDAPRRQVIVEARVEEIETRALRELGINWGGDLASATLGGDPFVLAVDPLALEGQLRTLREAGLSKVLASPRIAAIEGEPAEILIGDRIGIVLETVDEAGNVSQSVEYVEVGVKLNITASVSEDAMVTMQISTEVSHMDEDLTDRFRFPNVRTREMNSMVRVRDGQSLVIGGLIQEVESEETQGLPILSDLPLLGRLFSRNVTNTRETEMVVFLIPHIVHDDPHAVAPAKQSGNQPAPDESGSAGESATPDADAGQRRNPAHQPVGSVIPLRDGVGTRLTTGPDNVSVAWLDVTSHVHGAFDLGLERRSGDTGVLTHLYYSADTAWGVGASWRRYGAEVAGVRPWAGLSAEYIKPFEQDEATYVLSASVGLGTREAAPLRLELYGKYSLLYGGVVWPAVDLPARTEGISTGLRLGWEY